MNKIGYFVVGAMMMVSGLVFGAEPAPAAAPQGSAVSTAKKILVVYYSRTGNTKKVAEEAARILGADVEALIDKKDRSGVGGYVGAGKDATQKKLADIEPVKTDASKYDLVVIGTPVWGWNMTPAVRTYIANNKAVLKQIAVFTTAGGTKPDKIVAAIEELAGKKALAFEGFFQGEIKDKNSAKYEDKLHAFLAKLR